MTKSVRELHRFLFYLLILFLPTQLGKHFWPDWSLVGGIRIDYLSPTIYFTDLLVVGILMSWISASLNIKYQISNIKNSYQNSKRFFSLLSLFVFLSLFFVVNISLSYNKPVALFKFLRFVEFFLLGVYVKNNLTMEQFSNVTVLLSLTVIYSSLIAWAQFLKQASICGFLWWLGERTFASSTPGIAQVVLGGKLFLRPYATFPHPNVLGGYIAAAMPLLVQSLKLKAQSYSSKLKTILNTLAILLGVTALFITFSRAAWVVGGIGMVAAFLLLLSKTKRERGLKRLGARNYLLSVICCLLFSFFLFLGRQRLSQLKADTESVQLRTELNRVALLVIKKYPLTGVGLNNFIPSLPEFKKGVTYQELQPAHNIFLLIGAEAGLVGLGGFLWLIFKAYQKLFQKKIKTLKHKNKKLLVVLSAILVLSLFDHYFFTLQQGSLLFALVLGTIFGL